MNRFLTLIFSLFLVIQIYGQEQFYYYNGQKRYLKISKDKIFVKFTGDTTYSRRNQFSNQSLKLAPITKKSEGFYKDFAVYDLVQGLDEIEVKRILKDLRKQSKDAYVNHAFESEDGIIQGYTDKFVVKLKSSVYFDDFKKLLQANNVKFVKQGEYSPNRILLEVKNKSGNGLDALEMANKFYETGMFEYSEPVWKRILQKMCVNDEFWADQWGLNNTGQHDGTIGADINVCNAWTITRGSDQIIVAVIDEGVDLNHPDLQANIVEGFDATGRGSNGGPENDDAHGTACAGIIAAVQDNGIGISGIAPRCRIMPVRIAFGDANGNWVTDDNWIADAIDWAVNNGADILSNSWGGGTPSSEIDEAINNAVINGRNGLGCPVLFAAGNNNKSVNYPAYLDNVIAVGATNMCNERKRSSKNSDEVNSGVATDPSGVSCDGEKWWGSNYGNALDIAAPGVLIPTTDIEGPAGYDENNNNSSYGEDYADHFNGTSSACPHAAGTMALILSVNPCLTQIEARNILEISCDKINTSAYCYKYNSGHPNGSWNENVGYGKINAFNAVRYAFSRIITRNPGSTLSIDSYGSSQKLFFNGGCQWLASGIYMGKKHTITKTYNFTETSNPLVIGTTNGLSGANPNDGNPYLSIVSTSNNSVTVRTWVYEIESTISGQNVGWIPCKPSDVGINLTILSNVTPNQDIPLTTYTSSANIYADNRITNTGNVSIESGANVVFKAGREIVLKPNFHAKPGSTFSASVQTDPAFVCTQYPQLKSKVIQTGYFDEYQIEQLEALDSLDNEMLTINNNKILSVYPNPLQESATIEYCITNNKNVTILIYDINGVELLRLKNNEPHLAGIYKMQFNGFSYQPGTYIVKLITDDYEDIQKIIITK